MSPRLITFPNDVWRGSGTATHMYCMYTCSENHEKSGVRRSCSENDLDSCALQNTETETGPGMGLHDQDLAC